jgi:hypothetical protein
MDRIAKLAAGLPDELDVAMDAVMQSVMHFEAVFARLDSGDVSLGQAEALEETLGRAHRLLSGVVGKHDELRFYIRKALGEAAAPGWVCRDGAIYKDVDTLAAD